MGDKTRVEWADASWNPIKMRCTKISEGCKNCYADRLLSRHLPVMDDAYPGPGEKPRLDVECLQQPFHWRKPRRIFVESMGDLFHEDVLPYMIDSVLKVAMDCQQHTFMVLTKRPDNMSSSLRGWDYLPNLWLGVTAENQRTADERIPILLSIPASVHFVSVEPMLGKIDLDLCGANYGRDSLNEMVNWVICGGETGPGARPMQSNWALHLLRQCLTANVPFFFKKWGTARPSRLAMPREFPGFVIQRTEGRGRL